jgi:hypothetical protein
VAPPTSQWAALEEHSGPNARPIVNGVPPDVEDRAADTLAGIRPGITLMSLGIQLFRIRHGPLPARNRTPCTTLSIPRRPLEYKPAAVAAGRQYVGLIEVFVVCLLWLIAFCGGEPQIGGDWQFEEVRPQEAGWFVVTP